MDAQSQTSHKYLLLQVWCGLLTISMVVMMAILVSNTPKSAEDAVSTLKPAISPAASHLKGPMKPAGTSASYIELVTSLDRKFWQTHEDCDSCSLSLRYNSIYCSKPGIYFLYAQVHFLKEENKTSVLLIRNPKAGKTQRVLVNIPDSAGGFVWVAKLVKLTANDSVSIKISGDYSGETVWGAFQLH